MSPFLNLPNGLLSEEGRKLMAEQQNKPAVQSSVLWGLAAIALPAAAEACKYLGALPPGILPLPVSYGVAGLGWLLALYGRFYGSNRPISGVFSDKR